MASTEEEVKRKLPLLARLGRSFGESSAASRKRREELNAQSTASSAAARKQFGEGVAAIKTGARQLGAGFSAGSEGRPVDTSAFEPGVGTTDKTPRPPSGAGPEGIPLAPDDPEFLAVPKDQVVAHADRTSDPFAPQTNIPEPNLPPEPAPTLANAGREAVPVGGTKVDRPPAAEGVPEGFINVIRGTQQSFLREGGGPEFRQVPGQTLEASEQTAARRDPAFNVQTQEDLDRGRINAQTINAEANRLNAQGNNRFQGIDPETGQFGIFTQDANGNVTPTGISPIVDNIVNGTQDFAIETVSVPSEIPGIANERQIRLNRADGSFIDITDVIRQEIGAAEFIKLRQTQPDADIEALIEQAEQAAGGALPQLRAAFSEQ